MTRRVVITVTDHQASEWSRMASDAYATDRNDFGHRYSVAAAIYWGKEIDVPRYDALMINYRRWLIGGWGYVETGELGN